MKKLLSLCVLLVCGASVTWGATTNVLATRSWVSNFVAGLYTNNTVLVTTTNLNNTIVASNRTVAGLRWLSGSLLYSNNIVSFTSNAVGTYTVVVTNTTNTAFLLGSNYVITANAVTANNFGANVGVQVTTSNTFKLYINTNTILVTPQELHVRVGY